MVHLVTGEAWHRGLIRQLRVSQLPWTLLVDRGDEIADAALEMHGVAAQAVVHQERLTVVIFVEKDF